MTSPPPRFFVSADKAAWGEALLLHADARGVLTSIEDAKKAVSHAEKVRDKILAGTKYVPRPSPHPTALGNSSFSSRFRNFSNYSAIPENITDSSHL